MASSPRIARSPLVSPGSSRSSSQLASLLAETLRENELLKRELSISRKNAEKYERLTASTSPTETIPPAGLKRMMEYEAKLEQAEIDRDEYQARIRIMQDIWGQLDHYLAECEFRAKDAREGFNKIFQDAGGQLQPMTKEQWSIHLPDIPFPNTIPFPSPTYLPANQQPARVRHRNPPLHHAPTMPIAANNGITLPSFTLPAHPSSRVRPRAESIDGPTYSSNGPPPAKKSRGEALYRDDTRTFSRSVSLFLPSLIRNSSNLPASNLEHRTTPLTTGLIIAADRIISTSTADARRAAPQTSRTRPLPPPSLQPIEFDQLRRDAARSDE